MTARPLPRLLRFVLRVLIPARRRADVITDLADDYAHVQQRHGSRARWWLLRESLSVCASYSTAPVGGALRRMPMWTRDLQLVLRGLRRGPVPALAAAALLSTGLLAVLLTTGLARTLLLRPVSATHGDALRRVVARDQQGRTSVRLSFIELQTIERAVAGAAVIGAVNLAPVVIRTGSTDVQTMAEVVDGRYFEIVGVRTRIGRGLLPMDDRPSAPAVAVLSEPFWKQQFGGAADAVGQVVRLNGSAFTVVGVADALGSSSFLGASVDAWVAMAQSDALLARDWRSAVDQRLFTAFVLPLADSGGVDARLTAAAVELTRVDREHWRERQLHLVDGTVLVGGQRVAVRTLTLVLAALSMLILVAGAFNISGVLLARAASQRRQVAVHLSMGSGRATMIRRQLLEGAILGLAGGAIALALYAWARIWFAEIALLPTLALRLDLPFDRSLILIVAAAGAATGMLLGLGPAIWSTRLDLAAALRDGDLRASSGIGFARIRSLLVSAQLCLALALIVGAALFVRTATALANRDLGFDRAGLVAMDFDVEPAGPGAHDLPRLAREALASAQATPGVTAAAMSNRAPVDESTPAIEVRANGADGVRVSDVSVHLATAGYFATVGIPIVRGRAFAEEETDTAPVAVINEELASRLWPEGDALDRGLYLEREKKMVRVVGIARNAKYRAIADPDRPHLYRPTAPAISLTLLARTRDNPRDTLRALQKGLDSVGPGLVGFFPRTLDDHLAIQLLPPRAAASAATALGALALLLSAVGLYGLVCWFVESRRREIGVRMAVGATPGQVRRLIVRQALLAALPGIVLGVLLAVALGVTVRAALFGVAPADPMVLTAGAATLTVVVLLAAYMPSRRASRTDPGVVLRN